MRLPQVDLKTPSLHPPPLISRAFGRNLSLNSLSLTLPARPGLDLPLPNRPLALLDSADTRDGLGPQVAPVALPGSGGDDGARDVAGRLAAAEGLLVEGRGGLVGLGGGLGGDFDLVVGAGVDADGFGVGVACVLVWELAFAVLCLGSFGVGCGYFGGVRIVGIAFPRGFSRLLIFRVFAIDVPCCCAC